MIGIAIVHDETYNQSWITARKTCNSDSKLVCIGMHHIHRKVSIHHISCSSMDIADSVMLHIGKILENKHLYDDWYSLTSVETSILISMAEKYKKTIDKFAMMSKSADHILI